MHPEKVDRRIGHTGGPAEARKGLDLGIRISFSGIITFGALFSAIGPYAAGWLHDRTGSYDGLLMLVMGAMSVGALAMAGTGRVRATVTDLPSEH